MVRYIDKTVVDCKVAMVAPVGIYFQDIIRELEVSFIGQESSLATELYNLEQESSISVRLIEKENGVGNYPLSPFKEKWLRHFPNIKMPSRVWLGLKLGQIKQNKVFVALGKSIAELDIENGDTIWIQKYADTPIEKIGLSSLLDGLYVLYSDYKFENKQLTSNFIKIDLSGKLIWSAETKNQCDKFIHFGSIDNFLTANTWEGWTLELNESTGQIINEHWSK
jgi:hypothetical protein